MQDTNYKLLIIDDHRLFADGLSLVLSQVAEFSVTTFYNARTVLDDDDLLNTFDLALIDLNMPSMDGFSFLQALSARKIKLKVIVVSAVENREDIARLLHLGAKGFLPKNTPSPVMLEAVKTVLSGDMSVPKSLLREIDWPIAPKEMADDVKASYEKTATTQALAIIRPRQIEVLGLIKDGHSNKEIAEILNVTESTIKSHIKLLFSALDVKNRTACVQKGIECRLI